MTTRSPARTQFLSDVLCTFIEDYGTNTWRQIAKRKMIDDEYVSCVFIELDEFDDDNPGTRWSVDLNTIARGINALVDGRVKCGNPKHFRDANRIDPVTKEYEGAGDLDAYDADMIVQAAVFGELRYG